MINKIIQKIISSGGNKQIVIEDDSFLFGLFDKANECNKRMLNRILNLLLLLCCVITCIVILIKAFVFYVHDVLLFENEVRMNQQGAFVPTQSCDREYAFFIFTSSDLWANTGVQVMKGDRIKILASGAFNSSVCDLVDRVKSNDTLKYDWLPAMPSKLVRTRRNVGLQQCLYYGHDAYFGSVLYQIQNSLVKETDTLGIRQLKTVDSEEGLFEEVDRNGTLFFAVNDIYLKPRIIRSYANDNRRFANSLKKGNNSNSLIITENRVAIRDTLLKQYKDSISLFVPVVNNYAEIAGDYFKQYFEKNPTVWFDDNMGDILICMEIERVTDKPFAKWYRECEFTFNMLEDERNIGFSKQICMVFNIVKWIIEALCMFKYYIIIFLILFILINYSYIFKSARFGLRKLIDLSARIVKFKNKIGS